MKNLLLTILLFIVSASFAVQSVFLYKSNTVQTVLSEEETKGDNGTANEKPDNAKDKLYTSYSTNELLYHQAVPLSLSFEHFPISKGFTEKPFTPPDLG